MPKEDYLLKYLEKLSRVVAAMFGLRDKGFPEDAIRLADETYKELLDFKLDELVIMPIDKFVEVIRKPGYSSAYLNALAQISHETAIAYQQVGKEPFSQSFYIKTLELYLLLSEKDKTFSYEREMLILEIKKMITK